MATPTFTQLLSSETQSIGISLITAHVAYVSANNTKIIKTEPLLLRSGWMRLMLACLLLDEVAEVLLYVHRNRRFIRDGSPGHPPRLSQLLSSERCVVSTVLSVPKPFGGQLLGDKDRVPLL